MFIQNIFNMKKQFFKTQKHNFLQDLAKKIRIEIKIDKFLSVIFFILFFWFISFNLLYKTFFDYYLKDKTYLIALENTNEKKPNWWFFGSYIILSSSWNKINIKLYDSYFPQTIKNIKVSLPSRIDPILWTTKIWFLGANMVWFTDIDWKNIAQIRQKTFDKKLDWVIFVKSNLLTDINSKFKYFIREQQYINANYQKLIENINWPNHISPKSIYFQNVKKTIQNPLFKLNFLKIPFLAQKIIKNKEIQIYFTPNFLKNKNAGSGFFWYFQNKILNLINLESKDASKYLLFFDYNLWFNKIDEFVNKTISFYHSWKKIYQTQNQEIININKLKKYWHQFKVIITYNVKIPQKYFDYISWLNQKYNIKLWEREKTILSIKPQFYERWVIYIPWKPTITNITWQVLYNQTFDTSRWKWIVYDIIWKWNNLVKSLSFDIALK